MKRRLFTLAAAVSLVAFLLLTTLCVRAQWLQQWLHVNLNRTSRITVTLVPSGLEMTFVRLDWPLPRSQIGRNPYSNEPRRPDPFFWPQYWFRDDSRPSGPQLYKMHHLSIPWWLVLSPGAAVGLNLLRHCRYSRRIVAGLCATCGYDLRATPDRCPECGSVPVPNETRLRTDHV